MQLALVRVSLALGLPRDVVTVAVVRGIAAGALRELAVAEVSIEDITLALSEACTNVIEHSGADDEYEVRIETDAELCEIWVIDAGHGLDPATLQDVVNDPVPPRGRGLAIMQAVVDTVDVDFALEAGTTVHLTKRLRVRPQSRLGRYGRAGCPATSDDGKEPAVCDPH